MRKTTFVDLEFDTAAARGAPLGDIASSLVSLHDLLRDLGAIAAPPASAAFRDIQVVAIEHRPLTVKLSLFAIPPEAVTAFQDICRDIILIRQTGGGSATRPARIGAAVDRVLIAAGNNGPLTETETARLYGHVAALQNAVVPLKRVVVKEE